MLNIQQRNNNPWLTQRLTLIDRAGCTLYHLLDKLEIIEMITLAVQLKLSTPQWPHTIMCYTLTL
jgi:hypothetical protein